MVVLWYKWCDDGGVVRHRVRISQGLQAKIDTKARATQQHTHDTIDVTWCDVSDRFSYDA